MFYQTRPTIRCVHHHLRRASLPFFLLGLLLVTTASGWHIAAAQDLQPAYNNLFLIDAELENYNSLPEYQVPAFLARRNSVLQHPIQDIDGQMLIPIEGIVQAALESKNNWQVLFPTLQNESELAQAQPPCLEAEYGRNVDRTFFSGVLQQLSIPVSDVALDAFQAWLRYEDTRACWNPLATTLPMPGSTDFNSVGVKNYPDRDTGIEATANTLLFTPGGTGTYYRAIREFLAQQSFDRQALETALNIWSGSGGYVTNLLNEWESLWNAGPTIPQPPQPGDISCTVALDPGHGGPDPGAEREGIREKDINWRVAILTQQRLTDRGYQVVVTRSEDEDPDWDARWQPAENADADFLVSIHVNAAREYVGGDGVEAWYQPASINNQAAESRRLAQHLAEGVANITNLRFRRIEEGRALYHPDIPSALIELAFISNLVERNMMVDNPELFAEAVTEAIIAYGSSVCGNIPPTGSSSSNTVMVFDTSGSMEGIKIQGARQAGNNVLDIISSENEAISGVSNSVGLVHFSSMAGVDAALSPDINGVRSSLQTMQAGGSTAMPDGLRLGIDMLDSGGSSARSIIILLSDGLPNVGLGGTQADHMQVRGQVLDLATEGGNKGYCIYTVGFGTGTNIDESLLREVAQRSFCGDYYSAGDVSQLANVYVQLRHASTGEIRLQQTGNIAQGQQLTIGEVEVPSRQSVMLFTLNWPGSQLDPLVTDPRGRSVDANYRGASITTKSSIATVIVNEPRAGTWQVGANGTDVPGGTTTYHAVVSTRAGLGIPLSMTPLWLMLGGLGVVGGAIWMNSRRGTGWYLDVKEKEGERYRVKVGRKGVWIGRDPQCAIHLDDPAVSRRHAWIGPSKRGKGELFLRDEDSQMGTMRNGKKVRQAGLKEEDEVTIGDTQIRPLRGKSA